MLKKLLVACSVLALTSSVAFATPTPYIGAGLGVTVNTANNTYGSFRGVPVNLFAGYGGIVTQNFYLAGELFGTAGTFSLNDNGGLKTTYGYGASLLPGFMLSDHTLAFARVGVIRTRFTDLSDTRTGGELGLGLQTSLTQNVDIRGEYDYVAYQSVSGRTSGIFGNHSYSTSPRSDQFNLGLVYKFD